MKRYLIFAGDVYYACGGMNDFVADEDSLEAAERLAIDDGEGGSIYNWWHVYDTELRRIVSEKRT